MAAKPDLMTLSAACDEVETRTRQNCLPAQSLVNQVIAAARDAARVEAALRESRATSEARREALVKLAQERNDEWQRAENAEGERDALRERCEKLEAALRDYADEDWCVCPDKTCWKCRARAALAEAEK